MMLEHPGLRQSELIIFNFLRQAAQYQLNVLLGESIQITGTKVTQTQKTTSERSPNDPEAIAHSVKVVIDYKGKG